MEINNKHLQYTASLAKLSIDLGIDELLESTNLNLNSTKSLKISISANLIESIIGAIFIDSNYRNCKKIVTKLFYNLLYLPLL